MATTRKIYTPKKLGHDYSDAERKGEIFVVFDKTQSPFQMRGARELAMEFLEQHPPSEGDMLLISGPTSLNMVLQNCLLTKLRRLSLLIFHARDRIYIEREVFSECPDTTTGRPVEQESQ